MDEKLTIIIPTHERHEYLSRIIEYYSDIDQHVIIVDSSDKAYAEKIVNKHIEYNHLPGMDPVNRIINAIDNVKTPYIIMCADDDFIVKSSFQQCVSFLESNSDYETVQGFILAFVNHGDKIDFRLMYRHVLNVNINSNSPVVRLEKYYSNFIQTFYTVRRKEALKNAMLAVRDNNIQGKLVDQTVCMHSIISGKMKVLPVFFGVREYVLNSASQALVSLEELYFDKKHSDLMISFYRTCSNYLTKYIDLSSIEAEKIIKEIYSSWIKNRHKNKTRSIGYFNKLNIRIRNKLIKYGLDRVHNSFGIIQKRPGHIKLKNELENRELQKIKDLIQKHNIKSL